MGREVKRITETLDLEKGILIQPVANGGWLIQQYESRIERPVDIGAYTTTADMLADLQTALGSE